MPVQMRPVFSSHVKAIGYDTASGELHVDYKNGSKSVYTGVPPGVYQKVSGAASIGTALHTYVKGQFSHKYKEG